MCCTSSAVRWIRSFTTSCHVASDKRLSRRSVVDTRHKDHGTRRMSLSSGQQSPSYDEVTSHSLPRCLRHIFIISSSCSSYIHIDYYVDVADKLTKPQWASEVKQWRQENYLVNASNAAASTNWRGLTLDRHTALRVKPVMIDYKDEWTCTWSTMTDVRMTPWAPCGVIVTCRSYN